MKRASHGGRASGARLVSRVVAIGLGPVLIAGPLAGAALAKAPARPAAPVVAASPADPTNETSAAFSFTSTSMASRFKFLCQLDGVGKSCNSHTTVTATGHSGSVSFNGPLAEGHHIFRVRAQARGKMSLWKAFAWVIDLTPPVAPTVDVPATPTNHQSIPITFSGPGAASFLCSLDGAALSACTSPFTTPVLPDGSHDLGVLAVDAAGNRSSATHVQWIVDTLPPRKPVIQTGPASATDQTTADFIIANPDSDATLKCKLDSGAFSACSTTPTFPAPTGAHTLSVEAVDAAGNVAPAAAEWSWTVFAPGSVVTPPVITAGPSTPSNDASPTFTFTKPVAGATYQCKLDSGAYGDCDSPATKAVSGDGQHTFYVKTVVSVSSQSAPAQYVWTLDSTRPVATRVAPKSVLGPVVVVFSEPVKHVSRNTVHLRVAGTAKNLALRPLVCANGAVVVSCAGSVTVVALYPVHPLMPGQHYRALVSSSITDLAGNVVMSKLTGFRAPLAVEENNVVVDDAWRVGSATGAYGHSFVTSHDGGSTASYAFKGTAIRWYTVKGPNQGRAAVFVDGVRRSVVNNYAAETSYRVSRSVTGLSAGPHRLTIKVLGRKGARAATGTWVSVDAVKVGTKLTGTPKLKMLWSRVAAEGAFAKHYARSSAPGSAVRLTFRGTSIRWITVKSPSMGKAKVYLDGKYRGTFDQYSASAHYRVVRIWKGLADKVHTIKVVVTGTHHRGAKGNYVALDRFRVG